MTMAPRFWVLDDGPLDRIASALDPAAVAGWPSGRLFLAAQTLEDGSHSPKREAVARAISATDGQAIFSPIDLQLASPAHGILTSHFRPLSARATANLAEHVVLSWMLVENADAVFVTEDKLAATIALSELGRCRVAYSYEFYDWLLSIEWIEPADHDRLCHLTQKAIQNVPIPWRIERRAFAA